MKNVRMCKSHRPADQVRPEFPVNSENLFLPKSGHGKKALQREQHTPQYSTDTKQLLPVNASHSGKESKVKQCSHFPGDPPCKNSKNQRSHHQNQLSRAVPVGQKLHGKTPEGGRQSHIVKGHSLIKPHSLHNRENDIKSVKHKYGKRNCRVFRRKLHKKTIRSHSGILPGNVVQI